MSKQDDEAVHIEVASIYGARTQQGLVELTVNGKAMQLTLTKAREIRGMLDGAIEAAVTDELLVRFLTGEKVGLSLAEAANALLDFREMRQGSRGAVYPQ